MIRWLLTDLKMIQYEPENVEITCVIVGTSFAIHIDKEKIT